VKLTPDSSNTANPKKPLWDNTNLVAKILYRLKSHGALFFKAIARGASDKRLLISRFPYTFRNSKYPPSMHIEFTDSCDLKCVYCNNPHFAHPRQLMKKETFDTLVSHLKKTKVDRICMGGGEATLHPKFPYFAAELNKVTKLLTIVTNGHWKTDEIIEALVKNIDFIEISVEAGGKENFEKLRVGSNFELITENLKKLKKLRDETDAKARINLRLMVRPSQRGRIEKDSLDFWSKYADSIMPQYILKIEGVPEIDDLYIPKQMKSNEYPKCSLPFRNIQIRAGGQVPICQISGSTLDPSKKVIAGNILTEDLNEIWQGETFSDFRHAHRKREFEKAGICQGCKGC
jgi:MoaA/NifB/PqqE/SkfB family radical SAM enzyme